MELGRRGDAFGDENKDELPMIGDVFAEDIKDDGRETLVSEDRTEKVGEGCQDPNEGEGAVEAGMLGMDRRCSVALNALNRVADDA